MERSKADMFMAVNANKFRPELLVHIQQKLDELPDDRFVLVSSVYFQDPVVIIIIAIFLGWERFFIDDIGLGVLKIITCYGLGIWWLIDIFTAKGRTMDYNYRKLLKVIG